MRQKAFKCALPYTLPICAGFLFLGIAYGIYMQSLGFSFIYPMLMSITIFAGSMEFVAATLLLSTYDPLYALLLTLLVNARHLFYGISMLDKFKNCGWKKFYLIFGMCDESFSINATVKIPEDVDKGWFMFFVTFLNQIYWFVGASIGGLLGGFITINTTGIEFVMTALFIVIFLEQWLSTKEHLPALIGLGVSAISLILFRNDNFIIFSMLTILVVLTALRKPLDKEECL